MRARLALLTLLVAATTAFAPPSIAAGERDPVDHFFQPFLGDLRSEIADARAAGRKGVVVMYHFEECPACTRMKRSVLNQPAVQDWFRRRFTVLGIDIRGAQPITGLDGRTLTERDYGRAVAIRATPTFDFYGPDGTRLYRHVGGLYTAEDFLSLGEFVASGASRSQTFAQYMEHHAGRRP